MVSISTNHAYSFYSRSFHHSLSVTRDYLKATHKIEVNRGNKFKQKIIHSLEKRVFIRDGKPQNNVNGIQWWHIVLELAKFQCLEEIDDFFKVKERIITGSENHHSLNFFQKCCRFLLVEDESALWISVRFKKFASSWSGTSILPISRLLFVNWCTSYFVL